MEETEKDLVLERRPLGRTALRVSVLGFGGAPAAYLNLEPNRTAGVIALLLESGMNLIDTAANYPGSEQFIGDNLGTVRRDVILVSKCGWPMPDLPGPAFSAPLIQQTIDRSLRLLRTDVLEVMLLHSCDLKTLQTGDAMGALVEAKQAGKIKFAGYSGDNAAAAYAAALPEVDVIETSVSVADQHNIDAVLPVARKNGKGIIAKRPLANAAWKQIHQQPGMYQNYARTYTDRLARMKLNPNKLGIAGSLESAWPELALRFTLSQHVDVAVIGTTSLTSARQNLDFAGRGRLPADSIAKIRAAFKRADPQGSWMGQT